MPVFLEDPNQFSKQRLKSELVAHNVALPAGESKKQAYLELYLKYIDKQNTTDFSSDEDEQQLQEGDSEGTSVQEAVEDEDLDMMAVRQLTDKELKAKLLKFGVKAGPIIASTRALYEKKLQRLMEPVLEPSLNGTDDEDQYSDSEEEEDTGSEHPGPKRVTGVEQDTLSDDTMGVHAQDDDNYYYPQCFLPSTRMQVWCEPTVGMYSTNSDRKPDDMLDSTARESQALPSPLLPELQNTASAGIPTGSGVKALHMALEDSYTGSSSTIRTFSITQMVEELESRSPHSSKAGMERRPSGNGEQTLGLKGPGNLVMLDKSTMTKQMTYSTPETSVFKAQFKADDFIFPKEPVRDVLTEMFPDTNRTATGISATRRRPIKGAAGRPVKFKYPNTPLSPGTKERRELQCHLVPVWIQILVFLTVVCLLYLVYGVMEDNVNNPFAALLDNFSHEAELIEESSAFIAPQDVPVTQDVPIK